MSTKEAIQAMTTWVAAIADNVKNPIAGIGAALDHAEARLAEPDVVVGSLARVRERLAALNEYVTELADFARPAALLKQEIDAVDVLRQAARAAGLPNDTEVQIDAPNPVRLKADVAKLTLVVKALLRNGVEAVGAVKAAQLRLSTYKALNGDAVLIVEDNGPGMPVDSAQHAFEPFFTTKEAGTGLGLAIVRKYVDAHGGKAAIDRSSLLGGCRVKVTIPRDVVEV